MITKLSNQSSWTDSGLIQRHQYGISVVEAQTSLPRNGFSGKEKGETAVFAGEAKIENSDSAGQFLEF